MYLDITYKNGDKFSTKVREVFSDKEHLIYYREDYYKGERVEVKIEEISEAYTVIKGLEGYVRYYIK